MSETDLPVARALAYEVQTWAPNASTMYFEKIDGVCTFLLDAAAEIESLRARLAAAEARFDALCKLFAEGLAPCECCDEGVSYTTGTVCVACDGTGWREP